MMSVERALRINEALINLYFIRENIKPGVISDVTWFTQQEAYEASVMMRDSHIGRKLNKDGSTTLTCFVEPTRVRGLYAWGLATWADGGDP